MVGYDVSLLRHVNFRGALFRFFFFFDLLLLVGCRVAISQFTKFFYFFLVAF